MVLKINKRLNKNLYLDQSRIICKSNLPQGINFNDGTLMLVNKPLEWTSFDVVNKIKYAIKHITAGAKIKVGHAGTLDPMADGLLIVCTGKYTKMLESLSSVDKSYQAIVKIGATTPCYDREAAEENIKDITHITKEDILNLKTIFEGEQQQTPPIYSALKVKGQTAYNLARRGEEVEIKSRSVTISDITYTDITLPYFTFDVTVSKGTYIRSLANDMGKALEVGAYLYGLTRTRIGKYNLSDALDIDQVVGYIKRESEVV